MPRKRRYAAPPFDHGEPMFRPNYPFVSAAVATLMVALRMGTTFRIQPHAIVIDLSAWPAPDQQTADRPAHHIRITEDGALLWDDVPINMSELVALLQQGLTEPVEPGIVFSPDANASYELSAQVLNIIKESGVTIFCFGNLEEFRIFHKHPQPLFLTMLPPEEQPDYYASGPRLPVPQAPCQFHPI